MAIYGDQRKICGKVNNTTNALIDKEGKLATTRDEIDKLTIEHYPMVLENFIINEGLKTHQKEREDLCMKRIEMTNKTQDWTIKDVTSVIRDLKKRKSRDSYGISNELMQGGGSDLFLAKT